MRLGIAEDFQRKQLRRRSEYMIVLSFLSVVVGFHSSEFRLHTMAGLGLSSLGVGWTLTQYRLKRRTLPAVNSLKTLFDSIEKLGFCVLVIVFLAATIISPEHRGTICYAGLISLLCLVFGTFATEEFWTRRFFFSLTRAQQVNFLQNFHTSVIRIPRHNRVNDTFQWNSIPS